VSYEADPDQMQQLVYRLRTDLATVTAEREDLRDQLNDANCVEAQQIASLQTTLDSERRAHADTRAELSEKTALLTAEVQSFAEMRSRLAAELAEARARVKELESELEEAVWNAMGDDL